ncbi:MAG: hypothetical protein GXY85_06805 [Candidatus Brocadiaceae bacterium]|nr:hypothetical protein [Candidatus Brocadiaceae bacterium]
MADKDDGFIRFRCRTCGTRLKVKVGVEGGGVMPCPRCGATVTVPIGNLEAVAEGTAMDETGDPGRLNVDPELLMKRLRGDDEKRDGPGSVGGGPSLRGGAWDPAAAFGRLTELDQVQAAVAKIDEDVMGQIQRLYRQKDRTAQDREEEVRVAGERRRDEIRQMLLNRVQTARFQVRRLESMENRLERTDRDTLHRLRRALEAMELYARHVHGLDL